MNKSVVFYFVFFLLLSLSFPNDASAQKRRFHFQNRIDHDFKAYHFGFSLGFNQMNFALRPVENLHNIGLNYGPNEFEFDSLYSVLPGAENGFHIGIVSNLKLAEQLDLRFVPTLSFGDRQLVYEGIKNNSPITRRQTIESTFIDFPLHLKYKSVRMVNTRVYILGGFKYSHDLASAEDKDTQDEEVYARISRNDVYYEVGVGFDYYFPFFKFSTELKGSFGLNNLIKPENTVYTNSIDRLNSRIIMISFLFE